MAETENKFFGSSPVLNFFKAVFLVIIAVIAFRLLKSVIALVITGVVLLVIGLVIYGVFQGLTKKG